MFMVSMESINRVDGGFMFVALTRLKQSKESMENLCF